jgi:hypothetical protein
MAEEKSARAISMNFKRSARAIRRRVERLHLSWRKARQNRMADSVHPAALTGK